MKNLAKTVAYNALFTFTEADLFRAQYEIEKSIKDAHKHVSRSLDMGSREEYAHDWYEWQEQVEYGDAVLSRS